MISRVSTIAAGVVLLSALAWALVWPGYHLSRSAESNPIVQDNGFLFKIIYYHEQNLGKLYDKFF